MARSPLLSVLDLCPVLSGQSAAEALRNSVGLAQHADSLGFHRLWYAEHHAMRGIASTSPEILIAHVAQQTERLRVGSGGIMLPNHAALKVAEAFRTLEALHPGRIDLGLGRAPGSGAKATVALRGRSGDLRADHFPEQLTELMDFLRDDPDPDSTALFAAPVGVGMPEIWILGSSDFGARLAAERGLRFAFAQHFSSLPARDVLRIYRENFRPSRDLAVPYSIVASHVISAETREEAVELARSTEYSWFKFRQTGQSGTLPSLDEIRALKIPESDWEFIRLQSMPKFVGAAREVGAILRNFVADVGADELMVMTMVHDFAARKRSYSLVADAFRS